MEFIPTFLYIKQHAITGKLYLGKTNGDIKHLLKYTGSGTRWTLHFNKHGKEHVVTLWYKLYDNPFDLVADALSMSNAFNIVESNSWLNLIPENGLCGISRGFKHSEETLKIIGKASENRIITTEARQNMSIAQTKWKRKPLTEKQKQNLSNILKGRKKRPHTQEERNAISLRQKGKKLTENHKMKIGKLICILTPYGFVIETWASDFCRTYNISRKLLDKCFNNNEPCNGFLLINP